MNQPPFQPQVPLWPCPRCHVAIPQTSTVCPNCGLQLVAPAKSHLARNLGALGVSVAILIVVVIALRGPSSSATVHDIPTVPAAVEEATPVSDIHALQGAGSGQSAPFTLRGGTYRADWNVTTDASSSCANEIDLNTEDGQFAGTIAGVVVTGATGSGTSYLNAMPAGQYFIESSGDCATWSVTLVRQ